MTSNVTDINDLFTKYGVHRHSPSNSLLLNTINKGKMDLNSDNKENT